MKWLSTHIFHLNHYRLKPGPGLLVQKNIIISCQCSSNYSIACFEVFNDIMNARRVDVLNLMIFLLTLLSSFFEPGGMSFN